MLIDMPYYYYYESPEQREKREKAQRNRNRNNLGEDLVGLFNILKEDAGAFISDQFTVEQFALSLGPLGRASYAGYELAEVVGTTLADLTLKEGVVGALDLYTPEIQRYEETALVGLGGMII